MKAKLVLLFIILFAVASCAPKITRNFRKTYLPGDQSEKVKIVESLETIPDNAESLGSIKIGDSGFSTNCDYEDIINILKEETRKIGGNLIHITTHQMPDLSSSCHRVSADIYKADLDKIKKETKPAAPDKTISGKPFQPENEEPPIESRFKYAKFRLAANGGWCSRTAAISSDMSAEGKSFMEGLRSGYSFSGSAYYFPGESYGIGFRFTSFNSSNKKSNMTFSSDNGTVQGTMEEKIGMNFYAFSFMQRTVSKKPVTLNLELSLGYLTYNDEVFIESAWAKAYGSTLGMDLALGLDYKINPNFGLGIEAAYVIGNLSQITLESGSQKQTVTLPENQRESLSHLIFSAGIRWTP